MLKAIQITQNSHRIIWWLVLLNDVILDSVFNIGINLAKDVLVIKFTEVTVYYLYNDWL